jgi:hypothetical protein
MEVEEFSWWQRSLTKGNMLSPSRRDRDGESSTKSSVSLAVDLVEAARIWGGQGCFVCGKQMQFFFFNVVLNCVAPLGMVSNEVPNFVARFRCGARHSRSARRQGCGLYFMRDAAREVGEPSQKMNATQGV